MSHSICYVDEAGNAQPLVLSTDNVQPVFLITGLFINEQLVRPLTEDFTRLKKDFFPAKFINLRHQLDAMPIELKGIDLKKAIRGDFGAQTQKHQCRFVDEVLKLLKVHKVKLASVIWIKGVGKPFKGPAVYATSTQRVAQLFEDYLHRNQHRGLIVSDFRSPGENKVVSHSIFTQIYRKKNNGNAYPSLLEAPLFGISNNHAGLQITDIITSTLLCPMATFTYCTGKVQNVHVNDADQSIIERYLPRIKALQYSTRLNGTTVWGISIEDRLGRQGVSKLMGDRRPAKRGSPSSAHEASAEHVE